MKSFHMDIFHMGKLQNGLCCDDIHQRICLGVQICGAYPDTVARAVELVDNECSVDFIDINMGCPIDIVVNKGAGSSLLTKPMRIKSIVQAASTITEKPLTVKVMQQCNY